MFQTFNNDYYFFGLKKLIYSVILDKIVLFIQPDNSSGKCPQTPTLNPEACGPKYMKGPCPLGYSHSVHRWASNPSKANQITCPENLEIKMILKSNALLNGRGINLTA